MISCGKVGQSFSFFRPISGGRGHKYTLAVRSKRTLSHALVREDIKVLVLNALILQQPYDLAGEPASWFLRGTLYEQYHLALVHQSTEALVQLLLGLGFLGIPVLE